MAILTEETTNVLALLGTLNVKFTSEFVVVPILVHLYTTEALGTPIPFFIINPPRYCTILSDGAYH
ncbi:MAG: hypothetical protein WKF59_18030 [Chitinophagaceae bacterium]